MLWQACREWGSKEGPAEQKADTSASAQSPAPMKKYLWIACRVAGSCNASRHLHYSSFITPPMRWCVQLVLHGCIDRSAEYSVETNPIGWAPI